MISLIFLIICFRIDQLQTFHISGPFSGNKLQLSEDSAFAPIKSMARSQSTPPQSTIDMWVDSFWMAGTSKNISTCDIGTVVLCVIVLKTRTTYFNITLVPVVNYIEHSKYRSFNIILISNDINLISFNAFGWCVVLHGILIFSSSFHFPIFIFFNFPLFFSSYDHL